MTIGRYWLEMIKEGFLDPRRSAQRIVALPMPGSSLFEAYLLVAIAAVLGVFVLLLGGDEDMGLPSPLIFLFMQVLAMAIFAIAIFLGGKIFGGRGTFEGSVRIMVWMQALMVLVQVVQLVALVILAPLIGILSMLTLVLLAWVCTGLIAGLHGFKNLAMVFGGIVAGLLVVGFVMAIVLLPFLPAV